MTIIINYTHKSGAVPETLHNVKSYKDTSLWSVEVTFNDESTDRFYGVESVTELSNKSMTNSQLKTVQENIASIREVAMSLLQSSDNNMIELAHILSDRCLDIEMEICNPEPEVMTKSYNSASNRIETIHKSHISSVPCYTFTFEEWIEENRDAITEYIA